MSHYFWLGASAEEAETGSRPTGQAASHLDASRFDPARCELCRFWARDDFGRALGGHHCDGSVSDCRRHAPHDQNSEQRLYRSAVWPTTRKADVCGDFEPRHA